MTSPSEGREGRRKRLAERGSDRMALITGQIQTLPPPPPPPPTPSAATRHPHLPPRHLRPESLPPELTQEYQPDRRITQSFSLPGHAEDKREVSRFSSRLRHQSGFKFSNRNFDIIGDEKPPVQDPDTNAETKHQVPVDDDAKMKTPSGIAEDKFDASIPSNRLRHQGGFKFSTRNNNIQMKSEEKPLIQKSDTNAEPDNQVLVDPNAKRKPSSATSRTQNTADSTKTPLQTVSVNHTFFSSRELNSCIIASETIRAFSALIIAIMVVLCYMISEKIAVIRPLYMILLSDITIVLSLLNIEKISASEKGEGEIFKAQEQGHDWNGVKLLERGLVAYQAIRGVFIDCSIYAVVVISGVSLM